MWFSPESVQTTLVNCCSSFSPTVNHTKIHMKIPPGEKPPEPRPRKKPKIPPPLKRGILWTWVFPAERTHFPGVHKIGAAISGPRIADTNFTDTRIFLTKLLHYITLLFRINFPDCVIFFLHYRIGFELFPRSCNFWCCFEVYHVDIGLHYIKLFSN